MSGVGGWAEAETVLARERRRRASAARYAERREILRLTGTASIAAMSKDVVRNIAHNLWTKAISKGGSRIHRCGRYSSVRCCLRLSRPLTVAALDYPRKLLT